MPWVSTRLGFISSLESKVMLVLGYRGTNNFCWNGSEISLIAMYIGKIHQAELQYYFRGEVFGGSSPSLPAEGACRVLLQLCQEHRSFQNLLEQLLEVQQSNPFCFCLKSFLRASPCCCFISFLLGSLFFFLLCPEQMVLDLRGLHSPAWLEMMGRARALAGKNNYRDNCDFQVCQMPASSAGTDLVPAGINGMHCW